MNQEQLKSIFDYKNGILSYKDGYIPGTSTASHGYTEITIKLKRYLAHRLIWIYHNGNIPKGMIIDHINGICTDNRIENLRLATKSQNAFNRSKTKNNRSGYKGVSLHKKSNKWRVRIKINYKEISLGYFDNLEEAVKAYQDAALKYQKEFAKA